MAHWQPNPAHFQFAVILIVDIEKVAAGQYVAQACIGGINVTDAVAYDRIDTAIADQALSIPDGFAHFVQFTYDGMSTETLLPHEAATRASALASRLVYLNALAHERNRMQN